MPHIIFYIELFIYSRLIPIYYFYAMCQASTACSSNIIVYSHRADVRGEVISRKKNLGLCRRPAKQVVKRQNAGPTRRIPPGPQTTSIQTGLRPTSPPLCFYSIWLLRSIFFSISHAPKIKKGNTPRQYLFIIRYLVKLHIWFDSSISFSHFFIFCQNTNPLR